MNLFAQFSDALSNLNIKTILIAVGVLTTALAGYRLAPRSRSVENHWIIENVQVVLSVVVVVFLIIRPFLFQAFYIPSGSMEPTLMGPQPTAGTGQTAGDRLLVNKLIYRLADPRRFDIAVFRAPRNASPDEKEFIKRVIGLPGETVEVVPPRIMVDDHPAFNLGSEGAYSSFSLRDPKNPGFSTGGTAVDLTYNGFPFRAVVAPDAHVNFSPSRVEVNGKVELEDPSGQIQETSGLVGYGGDPEVQATVYSIQDSPRLAVIAGQKLHYADGQVLINGRPIEERYVKEAPAYAKGPVKLGPNEYFMMGDNRNNSNDSHAWGPLTRDRIIGRAEIIFWPVGRLHLLDGWLLSLFVGAILGYQALYHFLARR